MLKVLIVDDDFPVRMFLNRIIDWNKYGYEVVGEAIDGKEALEKIKEFSPDIVITDINMPIMNGIDLIKEIKKNKYLCKVIVLSCYDDFQYVKEALKLGANEYFLKNQLNDGILLKILDETKRMIDKERVEKGKYKDIEKLANRGLEALRQQFFREIVNQTWKNKEVILAKLKELELDSYLKNKIIMILDIDDFLELTLGADLKSREALYNSIMNISREILNDFGKGDIYRINKKQFLIVYNVMNEKSYLEIYKMVNNFTMRLQKSLKVYLNINISIGISEHIDDVNNIEEYFNQCRRAIISKFYLGNHIIIFYRDAVKKFSQRALKIGNYEERQMLSYLKNCRQQKVFQFINSYVERFKALQIEPSYVYNFFRRVTVIINKVCEEYDLDLEEIYGKKISPFTIIEGLETIDQLRDWIDEQINRLLDRLRIDMKDKSEHEAVCEAIKYINCNYMKNITLSKVAEHVHINMSYLSHLFKQETERNFVDYLKSVRIDQAKELIENENKKVSEIAKLVGINDRRYFSKLFKETVGMSPAQYRKVLAKTL